MSSVITLLRVLPEFYEYRTGTLIWRLLYFLIYHDCMLYYLTCMCVQCTYFYHDCYTCTYYTCTPLHAGSWLSLVVLVVSLVVLVVSLVVLVVVSVMLWMAVGFQVGLQDSELIVLILQNLVTEP